MTTITLPRAVVEQALEALEYINQYSLAPHNICLPGEIDTAMGALRERLAQPEPVQCEPQEAVTEDGWCDWVCPKPTGYLMQCCDCGLIHEVESRVVKYEPRPSEVFEVVDDPDLQVQWRMKRRDDISPKQPSQQEPVAALQRVMARLADLLDEDQFAEIECIVANAGVTPPASKPWVGLDDTDLAVCDTDGVLVARYWERVLQEKNA